MITSFFKPKPGCKRSRNGDGDSPSGVGNVATSAKKKQLLATTTSSSLLPSTSTKPLSKEAATLLSFLHVHEIDRTGVGNVGVGGVSWRKALFQYFATTNFTSLAKFVANER
jgi:hypothetical protein